MVDYEVPSYDDQWFQEKNDVSDLHAYYMSQFNLELENNKKDKATVDSFDNFKFGTEESIDFEVLGGWSDDISVKNNYENIEQVADKSVEEQNIKEVLLDLDSIEFDDKSLKTESDNAVNIEVLTESTLYESNNEYIDDESLIDELCREDGETCSLAPDFNEDYLVPESTSLPSIETVFSKRYSNYNNPNECQFIQYHNGEYTSSQSQTISNVEQFSYPNNILYNLDQGKGYSLPDTPTSCTEFNFERNERTVSISESVDSDVQSCSYFDESENFDDDDLFVNLDDFGLMLEKDNGSNAVPNYQNVNYNDRVPEREKQGERVCLWEHCYEKYPNQNTLVEHIERAHVNTYKGDEFSCLWRDCTRARRPFNARYKLLIHMRVHSGHKPNRCHHPGCGKAFSRLENLKIHVRSHTGERPYACLAPHCRKAFSNSSDRAKHQRTHFNARPYACGAAGCGKRYTDPSSLRKHIKTHPHITHVPRTCPPPIRPVRRPDAIAPSSPAKLATLRCIRDKLSVTRMQRL